MRKQLKKLIVSLTGLWALFIGVYIWLTISIPDLRNIRYDEIFGLTAFVFLYTTVLINPLNFLFDRIEWVRELKQLQKTLIQITFFFGFIHAYISFFYLLGGFGGLGFLNSRFLLAITLSISSLVILFGLVLYYKGWWREAIYLVGLLITTHALLLGSHFLILSDIIPRIFFIALALLLLVIAGAIDKWMHTKGWVMPNFGLNILLAVIIVSITGFYYFNPATALPSASVHAAHLAALNVASTSGSRVGVSFSSSPEHPAPGQNVTLKFKVYNANSGNDISSFDTIYDKLLHLVVVDSSLNFFNHIHPENSGSTFTITTQLPHDGIYHLYLNFQPHGIPEQQTAFTLSVGGAQGPIVPVAPDAALTKMFGETEVSLSTADDKDFSAQRMSNAEQILVFSFKDSKTGQIISDLQPYLGAFGHLVLINEETYDYIHVHPVASDNPNAGGPEVKFMPAALYSQITPGTYRLFGQFKRDQVFTTDFTIKIK